jgi:hypothetical protein
MACLGLYGAAINPGDIISRIDICDSLVLSDSDAYRKLKCIALLEVLMPMAKFARSRLTSRRRLGAAWLESLLVVAFLALLFQVFPSLWTLLWSAIDIRQWSRTTWMAMNVVVVLLLFGVRFRPNVVAIMRERQKRLASRLNDRNAVGAASSADDDYEARLRRDAEWAKRAQKRLPWQ